MRSPAPLFPAVQLGTEGRGRRGTNSATHHNCGIKIKYSAKQRPLVSGGGHCAHAYRSRAAPEGREGRAGESQTKAKLELNQV